MWAVKLSGPVFCGHPVESLGYLVQHVGRTSDIQLVGSTPGCSTVTQRSWTGRSHTRDSEVQQKRYKSVPAKGVDGKVTAGMAESNGSLYC